MLIELSKKEIFILSNKLLDNWNNLMMKNDKNNKDKIKKLEDRIFELNQLLKVDEE